MEVGPSREIPLLCPPLSSRNEVDVAANAVDDVVADVAAMTSQTRPTGLRARGVARERDRASEREREREWCMVE